MRIENHVEKAKEVKSKNLVLKTCLHPFRHSKPEQGNDMQRMSNRKLLSSADIHSVLTCTCVFLWVGVHNSREQTL